MTHLSGLFFFFLSMINVSFGKERSGSPSCTSLIISNAVSHVVDGHPFVHGKSCCGWSSLCAWLAVTAAELATRTWELVFRPSFVFVELDLQFLVLCGVLVGLVRGAWTCLLFLR